MFGKYKKIIKLQADAIKLLKDIIIEKDKSIEILTEIVDIQNKAIKETIDQLKNNMPL